MSWMIVGLHAPDFSLYSQLNNFYSITINSVGHRLLPDTNYLDLWEITGRKSMEITTTERYKYNYSPLYIFWVGNEGSR